VNRRMSARLEMGDRALEFSIAHQVANSPGYAVALKDLEELIARVRELDKEQERGVNQVRAATTRKRELKRSIRRSQLIHVATAAERAAKEMPGLDQNFDLRRIPVRNLAFQTVVTNMIEEAEQQKELLVRHGLVEDLLVGARKSLDEFGRQVDRAAEGRRLHIGARANMNAMLNEIVEIVRMFDGLNRFRFATMPDLLAAWNAASNIAGPPRAGGPADGTGGQAPVPQTPTTGAQPGNGAAHPAA
jgi:hypothetical protein